jgi:Tol biopolymer transport system component
LSGDGTKVAFQSDATNLASDGSTQAAIYVHDIVSRTTTRVGFTEGGFFALDTVLTPCISRDGSTVAFVTRVTNPDAGGSVLGVLVNDLRTGTTTLASCDSGGALANGPSDSPSLNADGTKVAFASSANNLMPGDTGASYDIFVKDMTTGTVTCASLRRDGPPGGGFAPDLSDDGTRVTFRSLSPHLVPDDTNTSTDIFLHYLKNGVTRRVSVGSNGE